MSSRLATDDEVATWRQEGWVLLEGLVGAEEIDAVADDVHALFPSAEEYFADPDGVTERLRGHPLEPKPDFAWPQDGPGFRAAQQRWMATFPYGASGALDRLCVHRSIVDFAERALGSPDIRLYQAHMNAKYSGLTNYEQPMHTDRNHSWLPAIGRHPWWNLEGFLYLSDVTAEANPTRMVSRADAASITSRWPVTMPKLDPGVYAAEHAAVGVRGSYLAYRSDTWHRGGPFGAPGTARVLAALAFKRREHEWIGYDTQQSRSTGPAWTAFVEGSTPRELALFGFPQPGHPIWSEAILAETAERYSGLDLSPWRAALGSVDTG